jgi:hypothetical protein
LIFRQTILLDAAANVRKTRDGYLVAAPRVARIGIQEYRGAELGRADMDKVRVLRPETEVFHKDSFASLAHRPITLNHPPDLVDASNWKKFAVGSTGDEIARDGDFIRVPIMLMDGEAIGQVEDGTRELSCGYTSDLDWTPGEWNGQKYDAVMTNIRQNHLAVCDAARGGPQLRIGDTSMTMKTLVVDGISVELADKDHSIISRFIQKLQDMFGAEEEKKKEAEEDGKKKDALIATKDAEIVTLKAQLADATDPAKLDAAVKARSEVIGKARAVLGDKLVVDGKSVGEIRRQVVDAKLTDAAKGWSDAQVEASFASLTAGVKAAPNPLADVLSDTQPAGAGDKARSAYIDGLTKAWQQPTAA